MPGPPRASLDAGGFSSPVTDLDIAFSALAARERNPAKLEGLRRCLAALRGRVEALPRNLGRASPEQAR